MDLSVVIPVYNSAAILTPLSERLVAVLDAEGCEYEVVFVEDGGPDDSWRVLEELCARYPQHLTAVQLSRNFGQHNAVMCGLRRARGRLIVTMDDDLQHPPEEIPALLESMRDRDLDLVYGCYQKKQHAWWRNLGSSMVVGAYKLTFRIDHPMTSFRCMRRELADSILNYSLNYTFIDGLLAWSTNRIGTVDVQHDERAEGTSGYSMRKLGRLALDLLTNFSLLPLQLASVIGLAAATLGAIVGFYNLVLRILGITSVPGYASLITTVLFLGGVQLVALGIIGEYLGRLHMNVNRRPQYVVRQVLGGAALPNDGIAKPPAAGSAEEEPR